MPGDDSIRTAGGGINPTLPTFRRGDRLYAADLNQVVNALQILAHAGLASNANYVVNGAGIFVQPLSQETSFLTKNDSGSKWIKGAHVTCTAYYGTQGSETAIGESIPNVYVRLGDVPVNAWCYVREINGYPE